MASQVKRYSVIYNGEIPETLTSFLQTDSRLGYAKNGLYTYHSIRARLLVINQAWDNQPADKDLKKSLEQLLDQLARGRHILSWESL